MLGVRGEPEPLCPACTAHHPEKGRLLAVVTHQNTAAHKASLGTGVAQADGPFLLCATVLPNILLPISAPQHESSSAKRL